MSQLSAPSLNLLSRKRTKFDKLYRMAVKARFWSGIVLVGYIGLLILVVMAAQIYSWRQTQVSKALTTARLSLASQVILVNQYQSVQSRSKTIKKIMAQRREVIDLWQGIRSILPQEVEMQSFSVKQDTLDIGFLAPHVVKANEVLDMVEGQLAAYGIEKSELSVSRSDDASYRIGGKMFLASEKNLEEKQ